MQVVPFACRSSALLVVGALVIALVAAPTSGCRGDRVERPELPPLDVVPPGAHELVRLQYNDVNDVYRAFVVGGAANTPLRLRDLRLALLTDEQIAAGKKPHLLDDGAGPVVFAGPRFKIGVLHGVVEPRLDENGKRKNVVVRTARLSWSPFLAPSLVDGKSVWHTPAVHYPPPVDAGALVGSAGSGPTREAAWTDHRRRHGVLPQAVRLHFEGYALAKDLPKDDANDANDADDADDANDANVAQAKPSSGVDAGPGGVIRKKRIIGAASGSPAEAARRKMLLEQRERQAQEAAAKRAKQKRQTRPIHEVPSMKPTP